MGQNLVASWQKENNKKIILSEDVYIRLKSLINLSDFESINNPFLTEYGTFLFGYLYKDGNVYFESFSEKIGNKAKDSGHFAPTDEMVDEYIEKLLEPKYNCFALVHTHPYPDKESGRSYSSLDVSLYKNLTSTKTFKNKDVFIFGTLLTASSNYDPDFDDISFISFDPKTNKWNYYPNIYVKTGETLSKLEIVEDKVYIDNNGKPYNEITKKQNGLTDEELKEDSVRRTLL